MKETKEARMGMIAVLALMLVSIKRRLPATRKLSSGITTLALAGIVLLVAAGSASAEFACVADDGLGDAYFWGDAVLKSCTLNGSMTCTDSAKPGLYIGADDIVINGAGFSMTGARDATVCGNAVSGPDPGEMAPAKHSGIINGDTQSYDNVVIRNLEIKNFCTGIVLGDGSSCYDIDNNTVTGCYIHDCGESTRITHGIHMVYTNNCNITKNDIHSIDGDGIPAGCSGGGNGIFMYGKDAGTRGYYNNFTCNNLHHTNKSGFFMKHQCRYNTISYNNASDNAQAGIMPKCEKSNSNWFEYNNMINNTMYGFYLGGDSNIIRYNTILGNGIGIDFKATADSNVVTNNTVCGNTVDIGTISDPSNSGDSNTCTGGLAGWCDWNCDNNVPVYFDYDDDTFYSNTTANCTCNLDCGGQCACCNPGMFDGSAGAKASYESSCDCQWDYGTDPCDCDFDIKGDARPDLVIQDLAVAWLDSGANETHYEVSYKVCNIGGGDSVASVARTTIDSVAQDDQSIAALAKNTCTADITVGPFEMDPDSDAIEVCADADNANPTEIDENNNCSSVTQGARKPDLVITWAEPKWTDKPNKIFEINHTVCNIGNATATGVDTLKTKVTIDGVKVDNGAIPSPNDLLPGNCQTDSRGGYNMSLLDVGSDGILNISLMADGNLKVDEINETNNTYPTFEFRYVSMINVSIDPCQSSIGPYSTNRTSVFIILENIENYGSGTVDLEFDESVVEVDTITAADCHSDTVTANRVGQGHWRITAVSDDGENTYVKFANVTFEPSGLPPQCSDLDLTVLTLYDVAFKKLHIDPGTSTETCKICIFELDAPVVTDPDAEPQVILNDNGRARVAGSNVSNLSVHVTDATSVASVTIDLTKILLGAGNATVPMVLQSGTNMNGTWLNLTYADRDSGEGNLGPGVNLTNQLYVNATDYHGNSNTGQYIELTVLRRGDVVRNNDIDSADYLYIMMYTVGLLPAPDEFVAGVVPADDWDGVDAGDALYLAMHTVDLVPAP